MATANARPPAPEAGRPAHGRHQREGHGGESAGARREGLVAPPRTGAAHGGSSRGAAGGRTFPALAGHKEEEDAGRSLTQNHRAAAAHATGTLFAAQVARDLFAGVFGDDIEAGSRIAPLVGYDMFQTPWS